MTTSSIPHLRRYVVCCQSFPDVKVERSATTAAASLSGTSRDAITSTREETTAESGCIKGAYAAATFVRHRKSSSQARG